MEITHVIRGEEWLPSMPLHVMLYKGFGWSGTMPQFAHLPLILKPSGNGKLSKRDGDKLGFPVFPINWNNSETNEVYSGYREAGYFPDAFVNILALLGWNDGTDKEIYSMQELIDAFTLERVGKSGSRFDPEKARWFNHQYMLRKSDEEIAEEFMNGHAEEGLTGIGAYGLTEDKIVHIVSLVKERADFVKDIWSQAYYFFEAPTTYDEATIKKRWTQDIPQILKDLIDLLQSVSPKARKPASPNELVPDEYESLIRAHISANNLNVGQVMNVLRLCLVGAPMGPGVFDIMAVLGPEETIARIERAVRSIQQ
jgi:glutamyl-tRNA synthetase